MTESVENAPKARKPRFNLENPGDLAVLESEWLKAEKGLDVTPAQVRGVLMFHGEFQRSDVRRDQREKLRAQRAEQEEERKRERARAAEIKEEERKAREAAKAEKDANKVKRAEDDGVQAVADAIESTGTASKSPEGPESSPAKPAAPKKVSKLARAKKAPAKAAVSAEF